MPKLQLPFPDKVRLPKRPSRLLRRERLISKLHELIDSRFYLVFAPAGYGKTSLLVDFASDAELPVCWYALDERDQDLRTFAMYLLGAVREQFPGIGRDAEDMVVTGGDQPLDGTRFISAFVRAIQEEIPSFFVLVLDDYHAIDSAEAVNQAVDLLLEHLPDNCRLIVSSRNIPTKLRLSRLAARAQAAALGPTDLSFSRDELYNFIETTLGVTLTDEELDELEQHSKGWIAAIVLSGALWLGNLAERLPKALATPADLFDYLTQEVFALQSREAQEFLLATSVLFRVRPAWCDRLLRRDDSAQILEQLSSTILLINPPEDALGAYRYHPLFQDYLLQRLRRERPESFQALHAAAAVLAEEDNDPESAMEYALRGNDFETCAELIRIHATTLLSTGKWLLLKGWFERMPIGILENDPRLLLVRAKVELRTAAPDQALLSCQRARYLSSQEQDYSGVAQALIVRAWILRQLGDYAEAEKVALEASEFVHEDDLASRSQIYEVRGLCMRHLGRMPQAVSELEKALNLSYRMGDPSRQANIERNLASVLLAMDRLEESERHYRMALALWESLGDRGLQAAGLNGLGIIESKRGNFGDSVRLYNQALDMVRSDQSHPEMQAIILRNLAEDLRDLDDYESALSMFAEALSLCKLVGDKWLQSAVLSNQAETLRLTGQLAEAEKAAREASRWATHIGSPQYKGVALSCLGSIAFVRNDYEVAAVHFRQACNLFKKARVMRELARAEFRYGLLEVARGSFENASKLLRDSIELASTIAQESLLAVEVREHPDLVKRIVKQGLVPDVLRSVLDTAMARPPSTRETPVARAEKPEPATVAGQLEAFAYGPSRVLNTGKVVSSSEWGTARAKELFFLLLAHPEGLRKEQIIAELWPDMPIARGNSQFHSTLYRMRHAVGISYVLFENGRYKLAIQSIKVDVSEFQLLVAEAQKQAKDSLQAAQYYEQAVALYHGPYLEDCYSDWCNDLRDKLRGLYLKALSALVRFSETQQEYRKCLEYCEKALAADNSLDDVHLDVMRYHVLLGEHTLAVHHYRSYSHWLEEEMGADPAPALRKAYERLLLDHAVSH